jgi:hypothetical protein
MQGFNYKGKLKRIHKNKIRFEGRSRMTIDQKFINRCIDKKYGTWINKIGILNKTEINRIKYFSVQN